jgi:hypothetical protein
MPSLRRSYGPRQRPSALVSCPLSTAVPLSSVTRWRPAALFTLSPISGYSSFLANCGIRLAALLVYASVGGCPPPLYIPNQRLSFIGRLAAALICPLLAAIPSIHQSAINTWRPVCESIRLSMAALGSVYGFFPPVAQWHIIRATLLWLTMNMKSAERISIL